MLITNPRMKGTQSFIICFLYMNSKDDEKHTDFLIIHADNIEQSKEFFYNMFKKVYWMIQILAVKLMSEVIEKQEYFYLKDKIKRKKINEIY